MKNVLLIIFSFLILFGCKTQKENHKVLSKENSSTNSNETASRPKTDSQTNSPSAEQSIDFEKFKTMEFVSAKENDTIFATIKKTPCFGTCPVYELMIFQSGIALYEGVQHVEKKGRFLVYFSEEEINEIKEKANEIDFFKLSDEYDSPVTDFPTTYTSIRINGKVKSVSNRVGGPEGLKDLENLIHKKLMQKEFRDLSN